MRKARRLAFWGAVAGVSIAANFALELAAAKIPSAGLRRLADFIHRGPAAGE
jgi:hypothetical protein